ncbi:transposase family protein [Streptomyces sp. NPDC058812]
MTARQQALFALARLRRGDTNAQLAARFGLGSRPVRGRLVVGGQST